MKVQILPKNQHLLGLLKKDFTAFFIFKTLHIIEHMQLYSNLLDFREHLT